MKWKARRRSSTYDALYTNTQSFPSSLLAQCSRSQAFHELTLHPSRLPPSPFTHSLIHSFTPSPLNDFEVALQLPVANGLAELAFLPFARSGEVLHQRSAATAAP